MTVIVYSCPDHGPLVEYDPPGPSAEHAPTACWVRRRRIGAKRTAQCKKLLIRTKREDT